MHMNFNTVCNLSARETIKGNICIYHTTYLLKAHAKYEITVDSV